MGWPLKRKKPRITLPAKIWKTVSQKSIVPMNCAIFCNQVRPCLGDDMPVLNIQSVLSSSAAFNAGIPVLVPFGSNNTAGNTIVVYISEQNGPPANFVVIDSQGNTYTQ